MPYHLQASDLFLSCSCNDSTQVEQLYWLPKLIFSPYKLFFFFIVYLSFTDPVTTYAGHHLHSAPRRFQQRVGFSVRADVACPSVRAEHRGEDENLSKPSLSSEVKVDVSELSFSFLSLTKLSAFTTQM